MQFACEYKQPLWQKESVGGNVQKFEHNSVRRSGFISIGRFCRCRPENDTRPRGNANVLMTNPSRPLGGTMRFPRQGRLPQELHRSRAERVIVSPPTSRRWFNGLCATPISREFRVAQKPLNHWDKPSGEKITGSPPAVSGSTPLGESHRDLAIPANRSTKVQRANLAERRYNR